MSLASISLKARPDLAYVVTNRSTFTEQHSRNRTLLEIYQHAIEHKDDIAYTISLIMDDLPEETIGIRDEYSNYYTHQLSYNFSTETLTLLLQNTQKKHETVSREDLDDPDVSDALKSLALELPENNAPLALTFSQMRKSIVIEDNDVVSTFQEMVYEFPNNDKISVLAFNTFPFSDDIEF